MGITELSNAYVLCTCGATCTRSCTVCSSTTWSKGPCVQQLWREHTNSDEGRAAAQRFNDMLKNVGVFTATSVRISEPDPPVLTDEQIVERTIDFAEKLGMYLEPWQAAALRAILLHGGDVAIGRRY